MKNRVRRGDKPTQGNEEDELVALPDGTILARKGRFVLLETRRTPEAHDALLARAREERERLPAQIDETVAKLRKLLAEMPVRETLSFLALAVAFADPETYKEWQADVPYIAVEYPTWLYLLQPENEAAAKKSLQMADLANLHTLIDEAISQTNFYFMFDSLPGKTKTPDAFNEIRFRTRMYNLSVRNPAYQHHLRVQLSRLFDPFENELRQKIGFSLRDVLKILDVMERLENDRLRLLRETLSSAKVNRDDFMCELARQSSHIFKFQSSDIVQASGLGKDLVESFLKYFSTSFGQPPIANSWPSTYEPLERAPLLKFSDDTWLAHLFVKLPWAIKTGLESALLSDPKTKDRYTIRRSRYLEYRAVEMIASTSRHARKWARLAYTFDDGDGPRAYELDGLVLVDKTAFLVEAKAGSMSLPARRGAESGKSELKELVAEAHMQTNRALRYLNSTNDAHFSTADGDDVALRRSDLSHLYLVSVTLESLSAFVTRLAGLTTAGILKAGELCWSVYELDLQVITEVVEGIGELVHYLDRRLAVEKEQVHAAEELDLFGHYLKEGLFLHDFFNTDAETYLNLTSYTEDLDTYYLYLTGVRKTPAPKPRQPMSLLLRRLIGALERNGPAGFIDAVCALLDGGSKTRRLVTNKIIDRRLAASRTGFAGFRMHLENCSVLCYATAKKTSRQTIDDYTKAAKYSLKSNCAVGMMQSIAQPNDLIVAVERYQWKEDSSLATFSHNVFGQLRSHHSVL